MNEVRKMGNFKMRKFRINDIIIRYIYQTENMFCVYVFEATWL